MRNTTAKREMNLLRACLVAGMVVCMAGMAWGQTTIYSQDFGSGTSWPTGWSNDGQTNSWSISTSSPSTTPTFSGGSNLSCGTSSNSRTVTFNNTLSTIGYENITILWGERRTSSTNTLTCQWSSDGSNWNSLSFTDVPSNSTWAWVNGGVRIGLPSGASGVANLRIRWSFDSNGNTDRLKIDDFSIQGTLVCTGTPSPGNTVTTDNLICPGDPVTLSLQNSYTDAGIIYLWQSSPNNTTFTNLTPVFAQYDFSSQPANTNLYGNASITSGYLQLTPATNSLLGGFVIQNTPGANITPFTVSFDYRIFDGTGADGMSLSYASNINNDAGPGEEGEGSGIILKLDTYDNVSGTGTNSQIRINYAGSVVWSNVLGAYNLRNTNYRTVRMTVDNDGYLTLTIGGTMIVNGLLLPGYAAADKSNWKFKFSGRTGGLNDTHRVDNLLIQYGNDPTIIVTPSASTYYRCQVTCATSNLTGTSTSVLVNVNPTPDFNASVGSNVSCFGGSDGQINIYMNSADKGNYTYSLNNGVDYIGTLSGTYPNYIITGLSATTHKIRIKDDNGCESADCP